MSIICPDCFEAPPGDVPICPQHGLYGVDLSELVHLEKAQHLGQIVEGRYALIGRIGAGGMGTVYRARQLSVGRDVAFKILRSAGLADRAAEARFHREARVVAALESDHTVPLYDFGRITEGPLRGATFMVMQLVKGISLADRLARGPLPVVEACLVMDHVADSLDEAHARGIVHRDLKPSNLMLTAYLGRPRVKVIDFGIARVDDPQQTQDSVALGTPSYMAPEMWRRAAGRSIDGRVDVYAMGVVLFQMLTGSKPHTGRELVEVARWHLEGEIPPLGRWSDEFVPIEPVVRRALARHPDERYPTVGQFAADLRAHLGDPPAVPIAARASMEIMPRRGIDYTPSHSSSIELSPPAGATPPLPAPPIAEGQPPARPAPQAAPQSRRAARGAVRAAGLVLAVAAGVWLFGRAARTPDEVPPPPPGEPPPGDPPGPPPATDWSAPDATADAGPDAEVGTLDSGLPVDRGAERRDASPPADAERDRPSDVTPRRDQGPKKPPPGPRPGSPRPPVPPPKPTPRDSALPAPDARVPEAPPAALPLMDAYRRARALGDCDAARRAYQTMKSTSEGRRLYAAALPDIGRDLLNDCDEDIFPEGAGGAAPGQGEHD